MCRLLGWAARTPRTLRDLLGADDLAAFTALSRKHGDGWGASWSTGDRLAVRTSTEPAHASAGFADWAGTERHHLGLVHLRWATLGLPVEPANTHPFTGTGPSGEDVAFAHNGSVSPPPALDRLLTDEQRAAMVGVTDSERYMRAVLSAAEDAPLEQALARTVTTIAEELTFTSLNCLLLTRDALYAVSRVNTEASLEFDEGPDYYDLRYRITDDGVVVASSGWGEGWQEIGNGEVLVVHRGTLQVAVHPLADLAAVG
jgi:predicted glutamine amidotransferase